MSPAKVMDAYRKSFHAAKGKDMLRVVINISEFSRKYMPTFDYAEQQKAKHPAELGLSELDTETYTTFGVIGGGIRSHFLYHLHPDAFPNRSQNSIWAFYFLTQRKDYGFEDGSEFLMINPDGSGTQQNYFYPYDLFTFYASRLFKLLKHECEQLGYQLDDQYRYIYLNSYLDGVAEIHEADINTLKPVYEQFDY
jgi:hypothetical protein